MSKGRDPPLVFQLSEIFQKNHISSGLICVVNTQKISPLKVSQTTFKVLILSLSKYFHPFDENERGKISCQKLFLLKTPKIKLSASGYPFVACSNLDPMPISNFPIYFFARGIPKVS